MMDEQSKESSIQAEIQRLIAKQELVDDLDIRLALQGRIDTLESQLVSLKKLEQATTEDSEEETVPETTPEQLREAENLIRQSKVEKMRGQKVEASKLLRQAADVAPHAATVLEAIADEMVEQKKMRDALSVYGRALKLAPGNVGLERKHANLVLEVNSLGSLDDQMKRNLSDSPFIGAGEGLASLGSARILNAIVPGVGHMVLGKTQMGMGLLGAWVLCAFLMLINQRDMGELLRSLSGHGGKPTMFAFLPIIFALGIYVTAIGTLGGKQSAPARNSVDRPTPPVDLPFE